LFLGDSFFLSMSSSLGLLFKAMGLGLLFES